MYCKVIPAFGEVCKNFVKKYFDEITPAERQLLTMWMDDEDGSVHFKEPEGWLEVWGEMRRGIGDPGDDEEFSEVVEMIRRVGIVADHVSHKYVNVGPAKFTARLREGEGDWALCRPPPVMQNAEGEMITEPEFGRVKAVYTHNGPNLDFNVVVRMQWFNSVDEGEELYHPEQRNPLVSVRARQDRLDVMWLAKDLIPLICWAARDFDEDRHQIMLARRWGVLRVLGFPVQPYLDDPYADVGV